jgi:hypothetical protein
MLRVWTGLTGVGSVGCNEGGSGEVWLGCVSMKHGEGKTFYHNEGDNTSM